MTDETPQKEVDAYGNATQLFQLINNMATPDEIMRHALNFPDEVKTWVVSRKPSMSNQGLNKKLIVWKYLPIHLICLQKHPDKNVIAVFKDIYPKGLKSRDHNGNLPIHYVLSEGLEQTEINVLDDCVDDEYKCLTKEDGEGRSLLDIIKESNSNEECKLGMEYWLDNRSQSIASHSPIRDQSYFQNENDIRHSAADSNQDNHYNNDPINGSNELERLNHIIESLNWKCDAKDTTIDRLTAQLMSTEKKLNAKRDLEVNEKSGIEEVGATASLREQDMKEELESLTAKMKIDATIVSSQQDETTNLKDQLQEALKMKKNSEGKHDYLKMQIESFQLQIKQHDEAVSHIRKVTTILQEEVEAKNKAKMHVQSELEASRLENEMLKKQITLKEQQSDKQLEVFQKDMKRQSEDLANLLSSFKIYSKSPVDATEEKCGFSGGRGIRNRAPEQVKKFFQSSKPVGIEDNIPPSQGVPQMIQSESTDVNLKSEDGMKNEQDVRNVSHRFTWNNKPEKSDDRVVTSVDRTSGDNGNESRQNDKEKTNVFAVDDGSEPSSISMVEIREKQSKLRFELRDIYSQIESALSGNQEGKSRLDSATSHCEKNSAQDSWTGYQSWPEHKNMINEISVSPVQRCDEGTRPWRNTRGSPGRMLYNI
uniref:Uncharacterized protein n=1 Tax=Chaetoceros debilis TaxID=122233 RepID=A0A7S3QIV0_9STRA|mmetsp:Transcript_6711/g.9886  ORF Transcript_6711/g.9886 Transcript_6711/m.9886 type:complete len:652 (+) Transcript_6711:117-2072(+)